METAGVAPKANMTPPADAQVDGSAGTAAAEAIRPDVQ